MFYLFCYFVFTNLISYLIQTKLESQLNSFNRYTNNKNSKIDKKRLETITNIFKIIIQSFMGIGFVWTIATQIFNKPIGLQYIAWLAGALVFGMQHLVKDYFNGLFNFIEGTLNIDDIVQISNVFGQVEEVTMRIVKIRDFDGGLHIIPFGQIGMVTSKSKKYSRLLIDVIVNKNTSDEKMIEVMEKSNEEFVKLYSNEDKLILDKGEVLGVVEFVNGGLKYEVRFKIKPTGIRIIKADYNKILKKNMDENDIELFTYIPLTNTKSHSNNEV